MNIQIGKTYALGELLRKAEEYNQIRDKIQKEAVDLERIACEKVSSGEDTSEYYPTVANLRRRLIEKGLLKS